MKFIFFAAFAVSLFCNFALYYEAKKPRMYGGDSLFTEYNGEVSVSTSGYLLWKDKEKQPKNLRQFWLIKATKRSCSIIDTTDFGDGFFGNWTTHISGVDECKTLNINNNSAVIEYRDSTLTITKNEVIGVSSDKNEKGGFSLISNIYFKE